MNIMFSEKQTTVVQSISEDAVEEAELSLQFTKEEHALSWWDAMRLHYPAIRRSTDQWVHYCILPNLCIGLRRRSHPTRAAGVRSHHDQSRLLNRFFNCLGYSQRDGDHGQSMVLQDSYSDSMGSSMHYVAS